MFPKLTPPAEEKEEAGYSLHMLFLPKKLVVFSVSTYLKGSGALSMKSDVLLTAVLSPEISKWEKSQQEMKQTYMCAHA